MSESNERPFGDTVPLPPVEEYWHKSAQHPTHESPAAVQPAPRTVQTGTISEVNSRRRRRLVAVVGIVGVAGIGALAFALVTSRSEAHAHVNPGFLVHVNAFSYGDRDFGGTVDYTVVNTRNSPLILTCDPYTLSGSFRIYSKAIGQTLTIDGSSSHMASAQFDSNDPTQPTVYMDCRKGSGMTFPVN